MRHPECSSSGGRTPSIGVDEQMAVGSGQGDSLRIRTASGQPEFAIPTGSITGVSVQDGTRNRVWTGAGLGVLGGVVLGADRIRDGVLHPQLQPGHRVWGHDRRTSRFVLGGAIGALIRTDRWRLVSPDGRRIRVAPRLDAPDSSYP